MGWKTINFVDEANSPIGLVVYEAAHKQRRVGH